MVFGALIEAIDLAQLVKLDAGSAREEIRDIVQRDHRYQSDRDVDLRAGRAAGRHLQ